MVSINILVKKILNVKNIKVINVEMYVDKENAQHLKIQAIPTKKAMNRCPYCHAKCSCYDKGNNKPKVWRALDFGGIIVEIECPLNRVKCKEHGVVTMDVPWAYPSSNFTKDFDLTVAWLSKQLSKTAIAEYMRIDWATVGRCISRSMKDLEPDLSKRLDNLVNIGIDETSYKKGHKYITVIVNHDTNTVVWAHEGHGKTILEQFYKLLTKEQRESIKVVTGDGARWITECVEEYTPNCERCVDPFHVVEWAMEAVDEVRKEAWREAQENVKDQSKKLQRKKGRPRKEDTESQKLTELKRNAREIKGSGFALGKAPENLTNNQQIMLKMIAENNPKLYRAYLRKEELRLLLKSNNVEEAEELLKSWLWKASHSRIPAIIELSKKIRRHKEHILNTIRLGMSNARIEATNNKIKLVIRKAYGFRNLQNMLDMVYMICSNLTIPLPNRKQKQLQAA